MVSQATIAITGVLQIMGISFFVNQPNNQCSPAPSLGAYLFLLAILFLLWDGDVIPKRYKKSSPRLFAFVEILATVFITELIMLIGWCGYERMAFKTASMICRQSEWCEYGLIMFITILGALITMCIVAEVVCPVKMKDTMGGILEGMPIPLCAGPVIDHIQDIRSYVMGAVFFSQLTRVQRFQAIRAFQMQLRRPRVPNQESQKPMWQEDPDEQTIGMQQGVELEEQQEAELEA
ncbi:hypothetical protein KR067_006675 [Drosophila pandora]|nr:hypothetical protein KR067_006675 [Drosophila pandora]